MSYRSFAQDSILAAFLTILVLLTLPLATAQVMQSGSYQIQSDSVNFGGGYSSSTNYQQESTFGEVATGRSTSTSYNLYAGYQQMLSTYLSITGATDVTLTPSLGGLTGGESNGSTTVTVVTDNPAGYALTIEASDSPAMNDGGNSIADYVPAGDPDFTFSVVAGTSSFGFSPEGEGIVTRFQDSVGSCNSAGGDTALACWDGLSTSAATIVSAVGSNHPTGATTSLRFRVGVGANALLAPGTYVATTTVTALSL